MASSSSSSNKTKSTSVSSSTFFSLKAELTKQKEEFARARASGSSSSTRTEAFKRPDKKIAIWARQNKGTSARNARDIELESINKPTLENAKAVLERKAKLYKKLRGGKTGGLTEKQYDSLLVDFDQPQSGDEPSYSSDSDVDESTTVPQLPPEDGDDPIVEYEDEFGRVRTARKSEVPRNLVKPDDDLTTERDIDPYAIYGDQNHFPVYVPDDERVAEIEQAYADAVKDPTMHYDASKDNRATAAGYYQFSADEETRARQMEALKRSREETENARQDAGIVDGQQDVAVTSTKGKDQIDEGAADPAPKITGRGIDKRKHDLEERRKAIEAKRRKTNNGAASPASTNVRTETGPPSTSVAHPATSPSSNKEMNASSNAADDFLAKLEADILDRQPSSHTVL